MTARDSSATPLEMPAATAAKPYRLTIGLPACATGRDRRFPLTPEAVAILTERGYRVKIQSGAADTIHYTDAQYMRAGAEPVTRDDALACDIVIHLAAIAASDVRRMRRGALLLTLLHAEQLTPDVVDQLLRCHIIAVAVDMVEDDRGHTPFADILLEIDGRAAVALAASLLASPAHGKGILLGGVAGIVPCEVTIIGSGIAARAAASSALGLGAMVRMLDDDVYRLRDASVTLPAGVSTSSVHPRVLQNALRTADVVIATPVTRRVTIGSDLAAMMKKGVIAIDLDYDAAPAFPSMQAVDMGACPDIMASPAGNAVCYTCPGNAVPRTAAMALSNTFLALLHEIMSCEGVSNMLKMLPGLQCAVFTFFGKPVNARVAAIAGQRPIDINILLNCS